MRFAWVVTWLMCAEAASTAAPAASFTKKPTAVATREGARIEFTVSAPTDVSVYIEGANGRIARHLAAGVLGKNAPKPLAADSLAQSLQWDGRDDDGRPAVGGPFKVRVGLGLRASYAGLAFADADKTGPNTIDTIVGLATDRDGRLYVMDRWSGLAWWSISKIRVFRRDGSYEKTIKPFPANLPLERLAPIGAFVNSFGAVTPLIYRPEGMSFYPQEEVAQQPAILADGRIVLATRSNVSAYARQDYHLAFLDTDGGVPAGGFDGPALRGSWDIPGLTASADGKSLYLVGVRPPNSRQSAHAVYRVPLPERGPLTVFFGDPAAAGNDTMHLSDPRATAVDGRGHLLIADSGNNRIVVVDEADTSAVRSFPVEAPSWVAVHPKTGAVYVCSKQESIVKFSSATEAKEVARVNLGSLVNKVAANYRARTQMSLALDASADPPVVWVGFASNLVRTEDRGTTFTDLAPADCTPSVFIWRATADPTRREVACRVERGPAGWGGDFVILDEATGQTRVIKGVAGKEGRTHRLGPNGDIYAVDHSMGVLRFDRDGKPKPFEATAKDAYLRGRLPAGQTGTTMWERDFWVDRKNDLYVRTNGTAYHTAMSVDVYDQAGRHQRTAIHMVSDGMYGPRVDNQGNLYILEIVKPLGERYPKEFEGRLKGRAAGGYETMHWYDWIYGSIVKFGPAGGAVWLNPAPASPLSYEGWRAWSAVPDDIAFVAGDANSVSNLRTTGGALTATILKPPATLAFPWPCTLDAASQNKVTFRLKNQSDGTKAVLGFHLVGEAYATRPTLKTIDIQPQSDFTEYTFDMSTEPKWKGHLYDLTLRVTDGKSGSFAIDWVRISGPDPANTVQWDFNAEDSRETKLPATMAKEKVEAFRCAQGAELQGALWFRPGFGHVGQCYNNDHCHCAGTDFDVDDFGRVFAPDTGRCRVGVLDTNGNEITSFGGYGNQDWCGPESYVVDPQTKALRPRKANDPKDLVSPFAKPEIAFGWIFGVAVTDRCAYVDDGINKRLLRVRLDYTTAESAEVK
jgi:hypothetical protein